MTEHKRPRSVGAEMAFDGRKFVREMMCRRAVFRAYMKRVVLSDGATRAWKRWNLEERQGWIVGATFLQTGVHHAGSGGGYNCFGEPDDYEPPYFEETASRMLVYLVTPWPTAKPKYVLPEDVAVLSEDASFDPSAWNSASRELAAQSKDFARGNDGRWISERSNDKT